MAQSAKNMRVFVDANILFSGTAFPRWPYEVLRHAAEGDFHLVLSPLVIKQARQNLQRRFPNFAQRLEAFLETVTYEEAPNPSTDEIEANKALVRDLTDVPIALSAISANVDYFVSEDKDFTAQDDTTAEVRRHLKIRLSGTFLREAMNWTSDELESIRYRTWSDMPEQNKGM